MIYDLRNRFLTQNNLNMGSKMRWVKTALEKSGDCQEPQVLQMRQLPLILTHGLCAYEGM